MSAEAPLFPELLSIPGPLLTWTSPPRALSALGPSPKPVTKSKCLLAHQPQACPALCPCSVPPPPSAGAAACATDSAPPSPEPKTEVQIPHSPHDLPTQVIFVSLLGLVHHVERQRAMNLTLHLTDPPKAIFMLLIHGSSPLLFRLICWIVFILGKGSLKDD